MKKLLLLAILGAAGSGMALQAATTVPVPYIQDFNGDKMPEGWKVVDANKDGRSWILWYNKAEISEYFKTFDVDDWLVSPGIVLNRTETYVLEYKASRVWGSGNLVNFKVTMGTSDNYEDHTEVLVPSYEVTDYFSPGERFIIHPTANGAHYFAFHAQAENTDGISFDDFSLRPATMPDKVSGISLSTPATYGDTHINVSFVAPTTTVGGQRLMGLQKIVVYRSGVLIKEYENPTPGEKFVIEDNCPYGSGNYQWKFIAYGLDGQEGLTAESPVMFVGINTPANPSGLRAVEKDNTGEVTVEWRPVTIDVRGVPMPPEFIDYMLYANGQPLVSTGATSPYTFQAVDPDDQDYLIVAVMAKSAYGSGVSTTPVMIVGKMYTSFSESFDNGMASPKIRIETDPNHPATLYTYDNALLYMYCGVEAGDADDTNGCMAIVSQYTGDNASIGIGKYDLSQVDNPTMKFYTYFPEMAQGVASNTIVVQADQGNGYRDVFVYDMSEHPGLTGWQPVTFDLSRFKDKPVAFKIKSTIINIPFTLFDGITIRNQLDRNLIARTPSAPENVHIDEAMSIAARVENIGTEEVKGASIALLVDGKEVASQPLDDILPNKSIVANFNHVLSRVCGNKVAISTHVYYADDQDLSDNTSACVYVDYLLPNYPAVTDLTAVADLNQNVELNWNTPSLEVTPVRISESFEDGEPNAVNNYGDWTFVDVDDLPTLVLDPNDKFPFQGEPMAGAIADAIGHYMPYFPATGNRFLAMCASEDGVTDDWAISPMLTGEAQEVTFWARSYDSYGYFREPIYFMISSTGKELTDFTQLGQVISTNGTWTQYSVDLPEGTKYFAIHYSTEMGMMLMLDEFSFIPAYTGAPLEVNGYNLYRDGEKVNTELVTETHTVDTDVVAGDHTYHVTTMFNVGESPASNGVEVKVAEGAADAALAQGVKIAGTQGGIEIKCDAPVAITIADTAGRTIVARTVTGANIIALPAGIYVVTAGNTTAKVAAY